MYCRLSTTLPHPLCLLLQLALRRVVNGVQDRDEAAMAIDSPPPQQRHETRATAATAGPESAGGVHAASAAPALPSSGVAQFSAASGPLGLLLAQAHGSTTPFPASGPGVLSSISANPCSSLLTFCIATYTAFAAPLDTRWRSRQVPTAARALTSRWSTRTGRHAWISTSTLMSTRWPPRLQR